MTNTHKYQVFTDFDQRSKDATGARPYRTATEFNDEALAKQHAYENAPAMMAEMPSVGNKQVGVNYLVAVKRDVSSKFDDYADYRWFVKVTNSVDETLEKLLDSKASSEVIIGIEKKLYE